MITGYVRSGHPGARRHPGYVWSRRSANVGTALQCVRAIRSRCNPIANKWVKDVPEQRVRSPATTSASCRDSHWSADDVGMPVPVIEGYGAPSPHLVDWLHPINRRSWAAMCKACLRTLHDASSWRRSMGGPRYVNPCQNPKPHRHIWLIAATKINLQPPTINPTCARLPKVQYPSLEH